MGAMTYAILGLMLLVVVVLGVGVVSMARGGEFNRKYANKLMTMRVAIQGLALLILAIIFLLSRH